MPIIEPSKRGENKPVLPSSRIEMPSHPDYPNVVGPTLPPSQGVSTRK